MDIDTLILSGGSTKGISFLGSLEYLIEKNYINKDLKNIKKIYCVSASFIFILTLILYEYNYDHIKHVMFNFNFEELLDMNDISLKNLFNNYGLINYNKNHIHIKKILKENYNCESMSLLKLYKLCKIHIVVKTINISEGKIEYIDHINNPKINILKLIKMTTSIPLLIKPVKYKGNLYTDGGLCGNCPIEVNDSGKFLCIEIMPNIPKKEIDNIFDLIQKGWYMYDPNILLRKKVERHIYINLSDLCINLTVFNVDYEMKNNLIKYGYNQTKEHFENH